MTKNGKETNHQDEISYELGYLPVEFWWHSGPRLVALIFLINALALTWLLLFDSIPRETLAWIADVVYWMLALILGLVKWPQD